MAHSTVVVHIHFVWTTKNRKRSLVNDRRQEVKAHMHEYAAQNGITIEALDVQPEHVHLLVSLSRSQRIEDIAKLVKGESSHWINVNGGLPGKFFWQAGYWAASVCHQHVRVVKRYIDNQDEHHRRISFVQEFEEVLREHGFTREQIAELLRLESR